MSNITPAAGAAVALSIPETASDNLLTILTVRRRRETETIKGFVMFYLSFTREDKKNTLQVADSGQRELAGRKTTFSGFNVIQTAKGSPAVWTEPIDHTPAPGPPFKDCL